MEKSIRVQILGREYALRVQAGNEAMMRQVAQRLNARLEAFRNAHPEQAKLTAAIITALALSEELHLARHEAEQRQATTETALEELADALAVARRGTDRMGKEPTNA